MGPSDTTQPAREHAKTTLANYTELSLMWPDPIFAQVRYHIQYKRPLMQGTYTESDNTPAQKRVWPTRQYILNLCMDVYSNLVLLNFALVMKPPKIVLPMIFPCHFTKVCTLQSFPPWGMP